MAVDGTRLGSLTTTWTMPTSCSYLYPLPNGNSETMIAYGGERCDASLGVKDNNECWPPRMQSVQELTSAMNGWGFYSPGIACPAGYKTACTAVFGERPEWSIQFSVYSGETALGCCPEGYTCTNWEGTGNTCFAVPSDQTAITTAYCGTDGIFDVGSYEYPATVSVKLTGDVSSTIATLWAPMFQLNYKSTDMTPSTSAPRSADTPAQTSTESTSAGGSSLSKGAIAGVVVGAVLGGALIGGVVAFLLVRRRHRRSNATPESSDPSSKSKAGMSGGPAPVELQADPEPVELSAQRY